MPSRTSMWICSRQESLRRRRLSVQRCKTPPKLQSCCSPPTASLQSSPRRKRPVATITTTMIMAVEWVAWVGWEWICNWTEIWQKWAHSGVKMPTVMRIGPYRFQFYAADANEPPHVHVFRDEMDLKVWLNPVRVARNRGYSNAEARSVLRLVVEYRE